MKKERKVMLIFGKTGTGKSTLAKKIMLDYPRKIIIDPQHEYREGIIFEKYNDFLDYAMNVEKSTDNFSLIIRFDNDDDYEQLFALVYLIGDLLLVVEEAEKYISPDTRKTEFNRLVNYGRHKAISILGIARRTAELSRTFRAQVDTIYSFKQTQIEDIEKMQKLGFQNLSSLNDYEFIKIDY